MSTLVRNSSSRDIEQGFIDTNANPHDYLITSGNRYVNHCRNYWGAYVFIFAILATIGFAILMFERDIEYGYHRMVNVFTTNSYT